MAEISDADWGALVAAQRPWLQALIDRQVPERAAAEDILQETLAAGISKEAERGSIADLRAWLGGVARNKSRQHFRSQVRRERAHQRAGDEPWGAAVTPLEVLVDAERENLVRAAVGALGEADSEILRMKYGEGMNYRQIGESLGIDHNAVTNRLRAARQTLRSALRRHTEDFEPQNRPTR